MAMENGEEAAVSKSPTADSAENDVTLNSADVTSIENKEKTVVVHSEQSVVTNSTLSTEPVLCTTENLAESSEISEASVGSKKDTPTETQLSAPVVCSKGESEHKDIAESSSLVCKENLGETSEISEASAVSQKDTPSVVCSKVESEHKDIVESSNLVCPRTEQSTTTTTTQPSSELTDFPEKLDSQAPTEEPTPENLTKSNQAIKPSNPEDRQLTEVENPIPEMTERTVTDVQSSSQKKTDGKGGPEIEDGSVKTQLHEIIKEIDREVSREEEGPTHHTWRPKGKYDVTKTSIKYEEIVPVVIPDVKLTERAISPKPEPKPQPKSKKESVHFEPVNVLRHTIVNGDPISPLEIPQGIPLLARILPKSGNEKEDQKEKIPLERLFTPATDTGEIDPPKKKKAFASSCFYRPDHPTIDDQVELAHKISVSLVDENNKASKGQSMYIKRKNRSSKWIHQDTQIDNGETEEERKPSLEKPPLKLVLNPKGMQDYNAVQRHYEELMTTSQASQQISRMEVGREIASDLESPTGKGAALFAKRKKRMDKFIIDETNVQQQTQSSLLQEENQQTAQEPILPTNLQGPDYNQTNSMSNGPTSLSTPTLPGSLQLPDLSQILTTPKPLQKKSTFSSRSTTKSKTTTRSRSSDSKPQVKRGFPAFNSHSSQKMPGKTGGKKENIVSGGSFNAFTKSYEDLNNLKNPVPDPLIQLRPGSPPVVLIPDGAGGFVEKQEKTGSPILSPPNEVTDSNEGGAIYTAEVKVVKNSSLPTTPVIDFSLPSEANYVILDQLSSAKEEEKRKSFNLAAKGWGTYSTFYSPIHLGAR